MSSSDAAKWSGRVFLGDGATRKSEMSIPELEGQARRKRYGPQFEEEFVARVQAKAQKKAKEILTQAQAEAEAMRAGAREEGFAEGINLAKEQLEEAKAEMAQAMRGVLAGIEERSGSIYDRHRQDIVDLVRAAVERVVGVELSCNTGAILAQLLDQALELLESSKRVTIRVHPEVAALAEDCLKSGAEEGVKPERWRIKADEGLAPGGMIVESDHGVADNSIESRLERVMAIFDQLRVNGESGEQGGGQQPAQPERQDRPEQQAQLQQKNAAEPAPQPEPQPEPNA